MIADVSRLTDNIDRILNLAKIESKSYAEEFVDVDLVDTLETFFINNEHLFRDCRIRINRPKVPLAFHRINRSLFEMLLMNLVTNAIKYNESDSPQIDIHFELIGQKLFLHFEDNRIGFDKKEIRKIFKKFYQIGSVDNMTAKGSALGLHLVQTIARIHKWKVFAKSEGSGKGSIFTLIMPAASNHS